MQEALGRTLADLVEFLSDRQVDFAVIGGIAVIYRGEPRFTADIDLVVLLDVDEALSLVRDLGPSPFEPLFPDVEEIVQKAFLLPLRHTTTDVTVDCALGMTGFERQVVERATPVGVGETELPVATAEDLILLKLLAARPRDTEDAHRIVVRQAASLDWAYLEQTGAALQQSLAQDLVPQIMRWRRELT